MPIFADDDPAYAKMWSPNEFHCMGSLGDWDVTARLPEIAVPRLVVCGWHDMASPALHRATADGIPTNEYVIFGTSSHLPWPENEASACLAVLREFISRHPIGRPRRHHAYARLRFVDRLLVADRERRGSRPDGSAPRARRGLEQHSETPPGHGAGGAGSPLLRGDGDGDRGRREGAQAPPALERPHRHSVAPDSRPRRSRCCPGLRGGRRTARTERRSILRNDRAGDPLRHDGADRRRDARPRCTRPARAPWRAVGRLSGDNRRRPTHWATRHSLDVREETLSVDLAHHSGLPSQQACGGGTDNELAGTWTEAGEGGPSLTTAAWSGSELAAGLGLTNGGRLKSAEDLFLDDQLCHQARYAVMGVAVDDEELALDVIHAVGPGGYFLSHPHTRKHMRETFVLGLTSEPDTEGGYRHSVDVPRERACDILEHYQPEALDTAKAGALRDILAAADTELKS